MKQILIALLLIICFVTLSVAQESVIIKAYPEVLAKSNDLISITWNGIESPTKYDTIAIYYPPSSDVLLPIGFIPLSTATTYKQGYGTVAIPLVNVRDTYVFRLWLQDKSSPSGQPILPSPINSKINLTLVASSNNVTFENPNAPEKPYLSFTNSTQEMRLKWISGSNDKPMIYYGTSPNDLTNIAFGTVGTYTMDQMCNAPANDPNYFRNPGYINDVVMDALMESTQYFYRFGSEADGFSDLYTFVSAPKPSTEAFIVAFGDLGLQPPFQCNCEMMPPAYLTVQNIETTITQTWSESSFVKKLGLTAPQDKLDIPPHWSILHIGDISYARGLAFIWDWYQESLTNIASRSPYMVSIGNHEYDYSKQPFLPPWGDYGGDSGGECGVPYNNRYHMTGSGNATNLWYSYEVGPIHFTQMSGEHDYLIGSEQYLWLEQDLKSVDRTRTPWLIFSGHRPMYCSQSGEEVIFQHMRDNLEPLLIEYDVTISFWAHEHVYERTCPLINGTCQENNEAPIHIIIGMAGNTDQSPWEGANNHWPQPDYSMFRAINYGYTRFYANMTDLFFEYVGNQGNQVHDSIHLTSKY